MSCYWCSQTYNKAAVVSILCFISLLFPVMRRGTGWTAARPRFAQLYKSITTRLRVARLTYHNEQINTNGASNSHIIASRQISRLPSRNNAIGSLWIMLNFESNAWNEGLLTFDNEAEAILVLKETNTALPI